MANIYNATSPPEFLLLQITSSYFKTAILYIYSIYIYLHFVKMYLNTSIMAYKNENMITASARYFSLIVRLADKVHCKCHVVSTFEVQHENTHFKK